MNALVLFSGGIDSTTALYWARQEFGSVLPLIIDYSQKHNIEVRNAIRIAMNLDLEYKLIRLPLKGILDSALLTPGRPIPESLGEAKDGRGIPYTYVPFRNGIFLSLAAGIAESMNIRNIITGFNRIDTPDYPDTTRDFSEKMEAAINEGTSASVTGETLRIIAPLIDKSKKEIIGMGIDLAADYSFSISCYRGTEFPCLKCPSCEIRSRAFSEWEMEDPLITRLKMEGKK